VQAQTWEDLLFAHWPLAERELRKHVPEQLKIDTFDGSAWLAVAPFRLTGLRLRGLLPLPYGSSFHEVNVRTCVTYNGKPGIYFLSLDASSRLAVEAARLTYRLPYFHARMSAARQGDEVVYASNRVDARGDAASLRARYAPDGEAAFPEPGSWEHFLTERYCLFTVDEAVVYKAEIHHPPWPLCEARAGFETNTMIPRGLELRSRAHYHFSRIQHVLVWPLEAA
jgi:uncharacterized protein YqjF (DUF2071 family)